MRWFFFKPHSTQNIIDGTSADIQVVCFDRFAVSLAYTLPVVLDSISDDLFKMPTVRSLFIPCCLLQERVNCALSATGLFDALRSLISTVDALLSCADRNSMFNAVSRRAADSSAA